MLTLEAIDAHLDALRVEKAEQRRTTELFWLTWWEDADRELDARYSLHPVKVTPDGRRVKGKPAHPALTSA